jgi:AraC-like DNA-binding protein
MHALFPEYRQMGFHKIRKPVLFNMLIRLATIFSFIILAGYFSYFLLMQNHITGEFISYNRQFLKQSASVYEDYLNSIIESVMVYTEGQNQDLFTNRTYNNIPEDIFAYENKIYNHLDAIIKTSEFVFSVYYFERNPESIYLSSSIKFDYEDFYDKQFIDMLKYDNNYYVLPARQMPVFVSGVKNVIPVIIHLPLYSNQFNSTYVINIDANGLFNRIISSYQNNDQMIFKITDSGGMILASTGKNDQIFDNLDQFSPPLRFEKNEYSMVTSLNQHKVIMSVARSENFNWWYIHYVDSEMLFNNMIKPVRYILIISLISLIISVACSIYVSKAFYKPVREIINIIGENQKPDTINEYEYIKNYLTGNSENKQQINAIELPRELEEKLLQSMAGGSLKEAEEIVASMLLNLGGENTLPVNIRLFSARLLNVFFKIIIDLDLQKKDLDFNNERFFADTVRNLLLVNNMTDCRNFFTDIINRLGEVIIEKHRVVTNKNVFLIKNYIDENFNKTLSLDIIADYISLNPSYTGRIFKQYYNIGVADYINQVRIEKAVELLNTGDYKINELALMTGFTNATYFIQIFKKLKGKTPGQYKENREIVTPHFQQ